LCLADNPDVRAAMEAAALAQGLLVEVARDPSAAVELASSIPVDAIVVDGSSTVRGAVDELRALALRNRSVIIVALTNEQDEVQRVIDEVMSLVRPLVGQRAQIHSKRRHVLTRERDPWV